MPLLPQTTNRANSMSDFYNLDELFTDEERIIRDSVKKLVDEEVRPLEVHLPPCEKI